MFKHFVSNNYLCLRIGLLKSRISEKSVWPFLRKPSLVVFAIVILIGKFLVAGRKKIWSTKFWHQLKRDKATFNSLDLKLLLLLPKDFFIQQKVRI